MGCKCKYKWVQVVPSIASTTFAFWWMFYIILLDINSFFLNYIIVIQCMYIYSFY